MLLLFCFDVEGDPYFWFPYEIIEPRGYLDPACVTGLLVSFYNSCLFGLISVWN